jgi:hypothetical protein
MKRVIALLCIPFLALLLLVPAHACNTGAPILGPERPSTPLSEIEKHTGVMFPYGATVIRHDIDLRSDALIRAKLVVTHAQWQGLLGCARLSPSDFEEGRRYLLGINDGWWNPRDPRQLPTAQQSLPGAKYLNVGIDRSDPERILVYFMWHAT